MSKPSEAAAAQYWGYLVKPDKSPSPVLEQLLLGIANYINRDIAPWDTNCLTPSKLGNFYRLVGGNYDLLFKDTPQASLAFIYQTMGCYHTLQPEKNAFIRPAIPALTPYGFVRWQTLQLLLEPDEHGPFLQEAVKRFNLTSPSNGKPFPTILPREALPLKPDLELTAWHERTAEKLMLEAQAAQMRNMPPRPQMALSDSDPTELSSTSDTASVDHSVAESESTIVEAAAGFLSRPRNYFYSHFTGHLQHDSRSPVNTTPRSRGPPMESLPQASRNDTPWPPLRRRGSVPPDHQYHHHHYHCHPPQWSPFDQSSHQHHSGYPPAQRARPRHHVRTPSTDSTTSCSSGSDYSTSTSTASLSPVLHSAQPRSPPGHGADIRRSNSMGYFNHHTQQGHVHPHHPHHGHHQRPPNHSASGATLNQTPNGTVMQNCNVYLQHNDRGLHVRWPDSDPALNQMRSPLHGSGSPKTGQHDARSCPSAPGPRQNSWQRRQRERREQQVGVGGRRYP